MMKTTDAVINNMLHVVVRACLTICVLTAMATAAFAVTSGHPIVVSMGDSYSSGEGTEPFYGQDSEDKYHDEDWLAHRSKLAWSGKLVVKGKTLNTIHGDGWFFTASSGATTANITRDTQDKDWSKSITVGDTGHIPPQLDTFDKQKLQGQVDYVTLTIGGNDLDFTGIVRAAVFDGKHVRVGGLESKLKDAIYKYQMQTKSDLLTTYESIQDKAGQQATLIVAGYPHLVPSSGRSFWCSADEAKLLNAAVDTFDTEVRTLINNAGRKNLTFVDVRGEFAGREVNCINDVILFTMPQDLKFVDYSSSYSVHPNALGQEAYARAVQAKIDQLESGRSAQKGSTESQQNASESSEQNTEQSSESSTSKLIDSDITSDASMTLVFDVSGSMDDSSAMGGMTKLDSAKKQSMDFVSSVGGQGGAGGISIKVGVASFASDAQTDCELSADSARITDSIDALSAYGGTNIYAGLAAGINQLAGQSGPKLMVFLSDGQSNEGGSYEDIISLAEEAHTEGIKIYTIGFGSSYDLDEDLLREIADITGGSYSHEDSSDISAATVGLFATMMGAQLQATSEVLIENTGTVAQDATTDVGTFDVDQSGDLTAYLYWPGSILDMQLTDPDGVLVDESYEGYTVDTTSIPTAITIKNAKKGTWHMSVFGREVSMAAEPFYAVAAFTEMAEEVVEAVGGGGYTNSGNGLFFLLIAMAIAGIAGIFAMSASRN